MTEARGTRSLASQVGVGIVTGVAAALVAVVVMHWIGVDSSPAVVGGVAGAVAGSVVPAVIGGKRSAPR